MFSKFAYYILVLPLSYLPLCVLYLFTDFFYLLLLLFIPYRKKVVRQNLQRSFPSKNKQEIKKIERQFYRHFTDILAEGIKNLTISKKTLSKRLVVENKEIMEQLYHSKKSVLLVSGHYNNWEWLITSQNTLFQHQAMGIGMPLTSKFWDKKINERRSRYEMKVVNSKNLKESITQENENPIAILILSDQSPSDSRKSYWMNFLNQETAVLFGTEQMAHEYNFAVVFFKMIKVKRGHYKMVLELITDTPKQLNWGEITEAHTHQLENLINEKPQFWIWSHKRWKRDIPTDLNELKMEQKAKFENRYKRDFD
ncbi:MAG: lysophospholipid acyltransferase family protein [Flavobacteriia bacterium]|nr:lysophospholipid acyltransferase family protein [Flavobacteriia bacterium]